MWPQRIKTNLFPGMSIDDNERGSTTESTALINPSTSPAVTMNTLLVRLHLKPQITQWKKSPRALPFLCNCQLFTHYASLASCLFHAPLTRWRSRVSASTSRRTTGSSLSSLTLVLPLLLFWSSHSMVLSPTFFVHVSNVFVQITFADNRETSIVCPIVFGLAFTIVIGFNWLSKSRHS